MQTLYQKFIIKYDDYLLIHNQIMKEYQIMNEYLKFLL